MYTSNMSTNAKCTFPSVSVVMHTWDTLLQYLSIKIIWFNESNQINLDTTPYFRVTLVT